MSAPGCSEKDFVRWWREGGAPLVAKNSGTTERNVYARRRDIEKNRGIMLDAPTSARLKIPENRLRVNLEISDGVIVVGSDVHCWPGYMTAGQRAFIKLNAMLKPTVTILNGDVFDGASISRHPKAGWDKLPNVAEELKAVREFESAVRKAWRAKFRIWTRGNHDLRYEQRLAAMNPEYEGVGGTTLKDQFPEWQHCMSAMINEGSAFPVMVKHRWHNGIHAKHNNTLKSGISIVTGHLHALGEARWSNYRGTHYGVDSGTLADPRGGPFKQYIEDNPVNWRAGFPVLTFYEGRMLQPEFAEVIDEDDGLVAFRGKVIPV